MNFVLLVSPGVYNTYFIGCLVNKEQVCRFKARPQFEVLFTVKYLQCAADQDRMQQLIRIYGSHFTNV